jgi:glycosyltransferase involved in cell wall biosynthesis
MRVALIDPSLFTLPYDVALAGGLVRNGHDVTLHGRALRPEDGGLRGARLAADFYRVADGPIAGALPKPFRLGVKGLDHAWSLGRLLRRVRQSPRPDVIHFQWLALPMLDRRFLHQFRAVAPLVLTVHDTNPFNGDPSAALQARGFHRCLEAFDHLIVHTAQGWERLCRLGLSPGRISVLPHGMLLDPAPGAADAMTGTLTFLLFGKIKPYKGADLLIEAFAALPADLRRMARIRIVGKPYMDIAPLRALAAARQVPVTFDLGFVADEAIPALFGPGTIATFPYREIEASGVLFMALAHGRPVLASRLGSFGELLTDGVHGQLVPPNDVAALSAAMGQLIADRGFAAACSAACYQMATDVPSWDEIARQTVQCYRGVGAPADTAMASAAD